MSSATREEDAASTNCPGKRSEGSTRAGSVAIRPGRVASNLDRQAVRESPLGKDGDWTLSAGPRAGRGGGGGGGVSARPRPDDAIRWRRRHRAGSLARVRGWLRIRGRSGAPGLENEDHRADEAGRRSGGQVGSHL